jgi:hypothetical protein
VDFNIRLEQLFCASVGNKILVIFKCMLYVVNRRFPHMLRHLLLRTRSKFELGKLKHALHCSNTVSCINHRINCALVYRVSHELRSLLRESVPYVKVHRYNPKHLCPKLNGYGDNGQRKVGASCGSTYCTC